ncbi:MAG: 50S ribosomal protein L22 [Thermodesulfobacteriota bacterium]
MEARATAKYIKVGPQKARLVVDQIRGKRVDTAQGILALSNKAISKDIKKLLNSAVANAENTKDLDVDSLFIKTAYVDSGPTMKRMRPRAMGRGNTIRKRSSHITIILEEYVSAEKVEEKVEEPKKVSVKDKAKAAVKSVAGKAKKAAKEASTEKPKAKAKDKKK